MSSVQLLSSAILDLESQTSLKSLGTNSGTSRIAQYETDVASYLWSESPGDLSNDAGWVSISQRGQQHQRSSLAMKTQALTPCIQNFCSAMDAKLNTRLEDLQHYLPSHDTGKDTNFTVFSCISILPKMDLLALHYLESLYDAKNSMSFKTC